MQTWHLMCITICALKARKHVCLPGAGTPHAGDVLQQHLQRINKVLPGSMSCGAGASSCLSHQAPAPSEPHSPPSAPCRSSCLPCCTQQLPGRDSQLLKGCLTTGCLLCPLLGILLPKGQGPQPVHCSPLQSACSAAGRGGRLQGGTLCWSAAAWQAAMSSSRPTEGASLQPASSERAYRLKPGPTACALQLHSSTAQFASSTRQTPKGGPYHSLPAS